MKQPRIYRHGHGSDEQHKKDQALFSQLMSNHHEIFRETEIIENGIRAKTTSKDSHIVNILQQHVKGMEYRFGSGKAIRSWDPLFAALFEYRDKISMTYHHIEDGVIAELTANDPKIVELIHCHDATLHGFIKEGGEAAKRQSPKPDWLE